MSITMDRVFGVAADALQVQSERTQLISGNIANADTPGYKARDIDFRKALDGAGGGALALARTSPAHLGSGAAGTSASVQYRVPANPSLDGNTVEVHREQAKFAEATTQYQAALSMLGDDIKGIIGAIKGE
ncbi:Flagellar basal body rod protein FlgB [wastewater metagenome]|uniref:Flagellar basal body rod protein FlgB n=2 Tax=unclassified sequences TaxID=12908 RepID=A0A5B8R5I1_9ZZZZ|nr:MULTISPECIES: flagellar basal body rod protein FlgB [Arhodomonas]MCS4502817.1 flagellar basal body rod protein FlgB [Arhodomonas aquaeolei]QEA03701.1 flagellar basal body rod protein FlgB [uncultured organism]